MCRVSQIRSCCEAPSHLAERHRIKQGDLTDPDYFDFISFAQYASVAAAMRNGRDIFEERIGAEGEKQTVQRNPDFADNGKLPEEHSRRVGDRILVRPTSSSRLDSNRSAIIRSSMERRNFWRKAACQGLTGAPCIHSNMCVHLQGLLYRHVRRN